MKRRKTLLISLLILTALCCITTMAGYILYGNQRRQVMEERPLVLIHAPLNQEVVVVGQGTVLHATARVGEGVSLLDLWIDNELVATRHAPEGSAISPLVLVEMWKPGDSGMHTVIARAESESGVSGQAVIVVEAVAEVSAGEIDADPPVDDEDGGAGEDIEDVPVAEEPGGGDAGDGDGGDDAGGDAGGGAGDNAGDDAGGGDGAGGDTGDSDDGGDDGDTGDSGDGDDGGDGGDGGGLPPRFHEPAPDSISNLLQTWGLILFIPGASEMAEAHLQVELLGLEMDADYESVHCYVGLGERDPLWYPDEDQDQSTDESFIANSGVWDIATHLSGDRALILSWPNDQPLPIDITCVGMRAGGTDAVDLGHLEIGVRPEAWDGISRRAVGEGEGGTFATTYRISRVEEKPAGRAKEPDPSMTRPTNLTIGRCAPTACLTWDYVPSEDEEEIDGFRIYLNGTLQWIEPPEARQSILPSQWLHPPCGDEYVFTVTAFRNAVPEELESYHSEEASRAGDEPGDPGCGKTVLVTFETLTTDNLGGDGKYDPGDVGPVYGNFYVNDQLISFDGRCNRNRCEWGLNHNSEYATNELAGRPTWLMVDTSPEDSYLAIGYIIREEDTGLNNEDELVCAAEGQIELYKITGFERHSMGTGAGQGSCRLTYTIRPTSDTPVVAPGAPPPQPRLSVENLTTDPDRGWLQIHIRNTGTAEWPTHDLKVALERPSGEHIGTYTWPSLLLGPGKRTILTHPDLDIERPWAVCAVLDPENEIFELGEGNTWQTEDRRYCRPLPDLEIVNVGYDETTSNLYIKVQNTSEHALEHRDIDLMVTMDNGTEILAPRDLWFDVSLGQWENEILEWPEGAQRMHAVRGTSMRDGYTVSIDPENTIDEGEEGNNTYTVLPSNRLELALVGISVPEVYRRAGEYRFSAYAVSLIGRRQIVSWDITCSDGYCGGYDLEDEGEYESYYREMSEYVTIDGDEDLEIVVDTAHPGMIEPSGFPMTRSKIYLAEDAWGSGPLGPYHHCDIVAPDSPGKHYWQSPYPPDYEGPWVQFHICRME